MARSGWAALVATVLLVAGLGSEPMFDAAADADRQVAPLLRSLSTFPTWSAGSLGLDSDIYAAIAAKILVLLVLVFVLGRAAGHVGASFAAFLAGWGTLMIAAAVAGVAYVLVADMVVLDGQLADSQGGAGAVVVDGLNGGVVFGLYTGWLVGAVVVMTARRGGLEAVDGWQASPPGRTLPVPPAGGVAGVAAAGGAPTPDPMGGMELVPGMPSVSLPGRAAAPGDRGDDAWAQPAPEPVTRTTPAAPGGADPWGSQPLSDPAVRAAPAEGPWAPQLQSTADAAPAATHAMGEPGPWATPPEPGASSNDGQPFVPPGSWRRTPGDTVGALPTVETPAVPSPGAPQGPIVPSGSWPPSAQAQAPASEPGPESPAGSGQPFVPSGGWPPSAREPQPQAPNSGATPPPSSYEQPEYSGVAPQPTAPAPKPEPGGSAEAGESARPLWPSAWPAKSGDPTPTPSRTTTPPTPDSGRSAGTRARDEVLGLGVVADEGARWSARAGTGSRSPRSTRGRCGSPSSSSRTVTLSSRSGQAG